MGIEWNEVDSAELGDGAAGDVGSDDRRIPVVPFSELAGRTRPRRSAKKLTAVMQLLLLREQVIEVQRIDSRGRLRGVYYRREPLSRRGVARRAGCSHTYVNRIFRQHVPCTNRVARR
jgi:AraC-like DNA-binding protein